MPIEFECAVCKHRIRVPDGSEGKRTKCPKCQAIQPVPSPTDDEFRLKDEGDLPPPAAKRPPIDDPFGTFSPQPASSGRPDFSDRPAREDLSADTPAASPSDPAERSEAQDKLKTPVTVALALVGVGVVLMLVSLIFTVAQILGNPAEADMPQLVGQLIGAAIALPLQGLALFGLKHAKNLENYGLAWVGVVLAALPCTTSLCCVLSLPFCVWAMVLLADNTIQRQFDA